MKDAFQTYICLWTQLLRTYDAPFAFREELCDVQWIDNMKNSPGAIQLLSAIIELFRNLIITAVGYVKIIVFRTFSLQKLEKHKLISFILLSGHQ